MIQVSVDLPVALSPVIILILPGANGMTRGACRVSFGQSIIFRIASFIRIGCSNESTIGRVSSLRRHDQLVSRHSKSSLPLRSRATRAESFSRESTDVADLDLV